jgi:hypothetical protein
MNKKILTIAVDFDGTLCEYAFPKIGEQKESHKELLDLLIKLRENGHKLILWTCRGDNEAYPCLSEAIDWCKQKGLEFDAINENIIGTKKLSGPSPKVVADFYLDDKAIKFSDSSIKYCLEELKSLLTY